MPGNGGVFIQFSGVIGIITTVVWYHDIRRIMKVYINMGMVCRDHTHALKYLEGDPR
jgi:hypothetical protein